MGAGASLWTELRTTEAEASDQIPPDTELAPPLLHSQFIPTIAIKGGSVGIQTISCCQQRGVLRNDLSLRSVCQT